MKRGAADGRPARLRAPHWHVRSAPPAPRRRRSPRRARALSVHRRRLSRPRRPTAARAKAGAARSEAPICAGGVDVDGAAETNRPVAIARGVTSKMSSGSGTTAPGTPTRVRTPPRPLPRAGGPAPAHHPRAPGGAQGQGDPLPMRHRAARGRASFPSARRPPNRVWRTRACVRTVRSCLRVQSAGHAVQRAARGVGVRGWDASRGAGRAWRRPPLAASPEAGAATTKDAAACIAAELERRVAQDVPPVLPPLPPPAPKSAKATEGAGGKKTGRAAATADARRRDAAHAPRAHGVRSLCNACGYGSRGGAPCGRWRVVR